MLIYHQIMNKLAIYFDMLCALMKHRVTRDENGWLIITIHLHKNSNYNPHFIKKRPHPHHLRGYVSHSAVLGLCIRTSHNSLLLTTLRHKNATNKSTIARSRSLITAITCPISITGALHCKLLWGFVQQTLSSAPVIYRKIRERASQCGCLGVYINWLTTPTA